MLVVGKIHVSGVESVLTEQGVKIYKNGYSFNNKMAR